MACTYTNNVILTLGKFIFFRLTTGTILKFPADICIKFSLLFGAFLFHFFNYCNLIGDLFMIAPSEAPS